MRHKQIETFRATDERGGTHVVCVMQHFRHVQVPGAGPVWEKSRICFIVDDEYQFFQDEAESLALPGLGRLTRIPDVQDSLSKAPITTGKPGPLGFPS